MKPSVKLLLTSAILTLMTALYAAGAVVKKPAAPVYLITNDDVGGTTHPLNTASIYSVGAGGALTLVKTVKTGGAGSGGGFFAAPHVTVVQSKTQPCAYVGDSNGDFNNPSIPDVAAIDLKKLTAVGTFPASSSDDGTNGGVSLAIADKFLVAAFAGSFMIQPPVPPTIGTYRRLAGCKLKYLGSIPGVGLGQGGIIGMKVTPDHKAVIVAYGDGSVGSYSISDSGALALIAQEQTSTGAHASGLDITADGKWAIFGDGDALPQIDVAPIANGTLGPTVNYKNVARDKIPTMSC